MIFVLKTCCIEILLCDIVNLEVGIFAWTNNMTKQEYREYFLKWKNYIRYTAILKDCGIHHSNFSQFLSGSNENALSVEKLEKIKCRMEEVCKEMQKGESKARKKV